MPDEIDWTLTTWEGNRRRQHAEFRALPLRTKLTMIEQMSEVGERFVRQRAEHQTPPPAHSTDSTDTASK